MGEPGAVNESYAVHFYTCIGVCSNARKKSKNPPTGKLKYKQCRVSVKKPADRKIELQEMSNECHCPTSRSIVRGCPIVTCSIEANSWGDLMYIGWRANVLEQRDGRGATSVAELTYL
eukprot:4711531-Karenia_brevis.AAC.1